MHVTVNLHCTYVTFYKLRRPWSQVINTSRGNWMLIGETIDRRPEKTVRHGLMIHLILISKHVGKRGDNGHLTASIHHRYYWVFVMAEGPVIPAGCPCVKRLGNKIHLFLCFSPTHSFPDPVQRVSDDDSTEKLFLSHVYIIKVEHQSYDLKIKKVTFWFLSSPLSPCPLKCCCFSLRSYSINKLVSE